jgi:recombinational DNA repair ATPase RecF
MSLSDNGDSTRPNEPDPKSLVQGLIAAREAIDPIPKRFVDQWWGKPRSEIRTGLSAQGRLKYRERIWLNFLAAEMIVESFENQNDWDFLRQALRHLAESYFLLSKDKFEPYEVSRAAATAVLVIGNSIRIPPFMRKDAVVIVGETPVDEAFFRFYTGLPLSDFRETLLNIQGFRYDNLGKSLFDNQITQMGTGRNAAHLLAEDAEVINFGTVDSKVVDYDKSDSEVRVQRVSLTAFRGSPSEVTIEFSDKSRAMSTIIFGDNGAGKSTIVDAIEFGLQGRVGRSTLYDSPVGPSLRSYANLNREMPKILIELNDSSFVERSMDQRSDGVSVSVGDSVRPGFRLAPVTLKRQDILRFLDTDGLARGQLFFDYFPTSAGEMALRPEEKLQQLDQEAYELRILRSHNAKAFAERTGNQVADLTDRERFVAIVKERITGGQSLDKFDWKTVDPELVRIVNAHMEVMNRLSKIKKEKVRGVELLNPVRYKEQASILARELAPLGDELTQAFMKITGVEFVKRIDVLFGKSGPVSLDLIVELKDGSYCFPQQLFSEGYRDLLAVLFFTSVAKRASLRGQAKILILDDVFQSVDSEIRADVMNYLLDDFGNWQLILTVHDRLWLENLRALFRQKNHVFKEVHLRQWSFADGPQVSQNSVAFLSDRIRRTIENDEPTTICGVAGRALEELCDNLSWRLQVSVRRQPQDRYSLGDLWPGVRKSLKKTSLAEITERVENLLFLRNAAGAHFNEWAETLSLKEATSFAMSVVELLEGTFCRQCSAWVSQRNEGKTSCPCGSLNL